MSSSSPAELDELDLNYRHPDQFDMRFHRTFTPVNSQIVGKFMSEYADPDKIVVELGAGLGALGDFVAEKYRFYVQSDRVPVFVAMNQKRNGRMGLAADAYHLPIANRSVGAVVAMELFDVVPSDELLAKEIERVVEPGGSFIHFHNRRPNMAGLIHRMLARSSEPDGLVVFPYVQNGVLERFQTVSRKSYERARAGLIQGDWCDFIAGRPYQLDRIRQDEPQVVDVVSRVIDADQRLESKPTETFSTLMNANIADALGDAGFDVEFAGEVEATAVVERDWAAHLLTLEGLRRLPRTNQLTKNANGYYLFKGSDPNLPVGQIRMSNVMSVVVGRKPH